MDFSQQVLFVIIRKYTKDGGLFMSTYASSKKEYAGIDIAKIICAYLVVAIHIPVFGPSENESIKLLDFAISNCLARIAIPFFFVASGFFLFRKMTPEHFDAVPARKYVLRILRLYILWTLIYLPLSISLMRENGHFLGGSMVLEFIRNFFLTGSYTHLWYMNALIFDVIFISILLKNRISPRHIFTFSLVMYIIGLFGDAYFGMIAPLATKLPGFWNVLHQLHIIFDTTRNGLFDGMLFVSIGMLFAFDSSLISGKDKTRRYFLLSLAALVVEVFLLNHYNIPRDYNMMISLIPCAFFGFSYFLQVDANPDHNYKKIRTLSAIIYYVHLWVGEIVREMLAERCAFLLYPLSAVFSTLLGIFLIWLSSHKKCRWVKNLYS